MENKKDMEKTFEGAGSDSATEKKFVEKIQETFNKILDRFMSRHPQEKELREFMSKEENLYDENSDNGLTKEYKKKIKEMEEYVREHPIDEDIKSLLVHDEIEDKMYSSIIDFVNRRAEIIKEYTDAEKKEKDDFDAEEFIETLLEKSSSEEEREEILKIMERLAEEDALEALDEEVVRDEFKKIINSEEN